ncbi:hypothetical protein K458DRAFT_469444, partial [Lentithecium fluviatile CBS 122367]
MLGRRLQYCKSMRWVAFAMVSIGCSLLSILESNSPRPAWVCCQVIVAVSLGVIMRSNITNVSSTLLVGDSAVGFKVFELLQNFGAIWGISLPSIIFNNLFDHYSSRIQDTALRAELEGGASYGYVNSHLLDSLTGSLQEQVISVYTDALKSMRRGSIAFAGIGFLLVFLEKRVKSVQNGRPGEDMEASGQEKQK